MASLPRIVRPYECLGGPLDGQLRSAPPPETPERLYVVRKDIKDARPDDPQHIIEAVIPPPPSAGSFTVLGYYTVKADTMKRRGTRERLWWVSYAAWPPHVTIGWKPGQDPPPDFTTPDPDD